MPKKSKKSTNKPKKSNIKSGEREPIKNSVKGRRKRKVLNSYLEIKQKEVAEKLGVHCSIISNIWRNVSGGLRWPSQKIERKKAEIGYLMNQKEKQKLLKNRDLSDKELKAINEKIEKFDSDIESIKQDIKVLKFYKKPIYLDEYLEQQDS